MNIWIWIAIAISLLAAFGAGAWLGFKSGEEHGRANMLEELAHSGPPNLDERREADSV